MWFVWCIRKLKQYTQNRLLQKQFNSINERNLVKFVFITIALIIMQLHVLQYVLV